MNDRTDTKDGLWRTFCVSSHGFGFVSTIDLFLISPGFHIIEQNAHCIGGVLVMLI